MSSLGNDIQQARLRAGLAGNGEMILLYWRIGSEITDRQALHKWGARVIDKLAKHALWRLVAKNSLALMRKSAEFTVEGGTHRWYTDKIGARENPRFYGDFAFLVLAGVSPTLSANKFY